MCSVALGDGFVLQMSNLTLSREMGNRIIYSDHCFYLQQLHTQGVGKWLLTGPIWPAGYFFVSCKWRVVFINVNDWKKSKEYFVTHENYMKFNYLCLQIKFLLEHSCACSFLCCHYGCFYSATADLSGWHKLYNLEDLNFLLPYSLQKGLLAAGLAYHYDFIIMFI
jgi:hypothetical protein